MGNQKEKKSPWITIALILSVVMALIVFSRLGGNNVVNNSQLAPTTQPSPTPILTDQEKKNLADTFCSERSMQMTRAVNLDDYIAMYEKAPEIVNLEPMKTWPPKVSSCTRTAEICVALWDKKECRDIAERKIWIGMDKDALILSWGLPNNRNNTVTAFGVTTQWVYGDFGPYVYLEGKDDQNLKVTSWQD